VITQDHENRSAPLVSNRTRRLAIVAGGVSGIAGALPYGPIFLLVPSILILGAIVQRWSPSPGRWLMSLGAFILTVYVGLFLAPQGISGIWSLPSTHDINYLTLIVLALASTVLVGWCDIALVVDARRMSHVPGAIEQNLPRAADRVVWLAALCLSGLAGWYAYHAALAYRAYGRLDLLLLAILFGVAVVFFDIKLISNSIKARRIRRSREVPIQ
jgi:hypothetical protein